MNKVYKSVWSAASGTYVAAAETTKSSGKKSSKRSRNLMSSAVASAMLLGAVQVANAADPKPFSSGGSSEVGNLNPASTDSTQAAATDPKAVNAWGCFLFIFCFGGGESTTTNNYYNDPYVLVKGGKGDKSDYPTVDGVSGIAIGPNAKVTTVGGISGIAIGDGAQSGSSGYTGAVAIGGQAKAVWDRSVALGYGATVNGRQGIAVGFNSLASGYQAMAIGTEAYAMGTQGAAFGQGAGASGASSVALGANAIAASSGSVALGSGAIAARINSVSVGAKNAERQITNVADATAATDAVNLRQLNEAIKGGGGTPIPIPPPPDETPAYLAKYFKAKSVLADANAVGEESVAIGGNALASAQNAIALGTNSVANRENTVSVGKAGAERQITNVLAGSQDTDAVNFGQLKTSIQNAISGAPNVVQYDSTTRDRITLGGKDTSTGQVVITNLKDGSLLANSSDAVNGSQLRTVDISSQQRDGLLGNVIEGVAKQLTEALGGGAKLDDSTKDSSKLIAPTYKVGASTYRNVGDAIKALAEGGGGGGGGGTDNKYVVVNSTGAGATASSTNAIAIGSGAISNGPGEGGGGIAIGANAVSNYGKNLAIGDGAAAKEGAYDGGYNTAIGANASAERGGVGGWGFSTALGGKAYSKADNGTALGGGATVTANNATALGANTVADRGNTVSVGRAEVKDATGKVTTTSLLRQIVNMAAGTADTDAVNLKQLKDAGITIDTSGQLTNAFVAYDDTTKGKITLGSKDSKTPVIVSNVADGKNANDAINLAQLKAAGLSVDTSGQLTNAFVAYDNTNKTNISLGGGATGTKITNLAAGGISAASTDAINGSQLYNTASSIAEALGGGAKVGGDGKVSKPSYMVGGLPYGSVGEAVDALSKTVGGINSITETSIKYVKVISQGRAARASGAESVAIGGLATAQGDDSVAIGPGAVANGPNSVALGGNSVTTEKYTVSIGSAGAERRIVNVADGINASDVVTLGQLNALRAELTKPSSRMAGPAVRSLAADDTTYVPAGPIDQYIVISPKVSGAATSVDAKTTNSMAIGPKASVLGSSSLAIGSGAVASLGESTSIGTNATTNGEGATAIGSGASVGSGANNATAVGKDAIANGVGSLSLGYGASTQDKDTIAIGRTAVVAVSVTGSVTIGSESRVNASNSVALGTKSIAARANTVSVGDSTNFRQITSVGAGTQATDAVNLSQLSGVVAALGGGAAIDPTTGKVTAPSYKVGGGSYTDIGSALAAAALSGSSPDAVSYDSSIHDRLTLGGKGSTTPVTVSNVADGKDANDAVNLKQLQAAGITVDTTGKVTNAFVAYDDTTKGKITLGGGAAGTTIANVKAGTLSASSTEAVNGSQLFEVNKAATEAKTAAEKTSKYLVVNSGGAAASATGGNAIALGDGTTATGTESIALGHNTKATGTYSVAVGSSAVADRDNAVSFGSSSFKRQLINVAAGTADTDAVNLKQLKDAGITIGTSGQLTNAFVAYDDTTKGKITLGGKDSTTPVIVSNVADGKGANDAVNLKQMQAAGMTIDTSGKVTNAFVAYDDTTKGKITLGGKDSTTPVIVSNVADGKNANDAVNLAQLKAAGLSVDTGGKVTNAFVAYDDTTKGKITLGGKDSTTPVIVSNVADGKGANDAVNLKQMQAAGMTIDTSGKVTNAFVAYDDTTKGKITLGGKDSTTPVIVSNVADGKNANDAVNLAQLKAAGMTIDTSGKVTNAFVAYDDTTKGKITLGGKDSTTPVIVSNVADGKGANDAVNLKQMQAAGMTIDTSGKVTNAFVAYDDTTKGKITLGGKDSKTPVIVSNVADGKSANDAVNLAQLKAAGLSVDTSGQLTNAFVAYDDTTKGKITLGGKDSKTPVIVSNVADGKGANDAVNLKQLQAAGMTVDTSGQLTNAFVAYDDTTKGKITLGGKDSTTPVIVSNVADGKGANDAVNLKQMQAAGIKVDTNGQLTNAFVAYDDTNKGTITLGGASSTKITNVASGGVSATSKDAINGSQLYETANSVAKVLGGGVTVGLDGKLSDGYQVGDKKYDNVGKAMDALSTIVGGINNITETSIKYVKVVSKSAAATASGADTVAIGGLANAQGDNSVAIGPGAVAKASNSVAIGRNSVTSEEYTFSVGSAGAERRIINVADGINASDVVTLGQLNALRAELKKPLSRMADPAVHLLDATPDADMLPIGAAGPLSDYIAVSPKVTGAKASADASSTNSMAIGPRASVQGDLSLAVGAGAATNFASSTAVGSQAATNGLNNVVVGAKASTGSNATDAVVVGAGSAANGVGSIAVGTSTTVHGDNSIGIGKGILIGMEATDSLAIGTGATVGAKVTNAIALGSGSKADRANAISVGSTLTQRQIVNVAAGTETTDAVNVTQLKGVLATIGGGAVIDKDGKVTTPSFKVAGGSYTDIGSALTAAAAAGSTGSPDGVVYDTSKHDRLTLGGAGSTVPVTLSNVADGQKANDAINLKQFQAAGIKTDTAGNVTNAFVAYDDTNKGLISLGGASGTKITNVAIGAVSSASKDAINGAQLFGTADSLAKAIGGGTTVDDKGIISTPTYTIDGKDYKNVADAISAAAKSGGSTDSVIYDTPAHNQLTLGGAGSTTPVLLANVAAGKLAAGSTQAVNAGQLFDTATSIAQALGGSSALGADGKVTKPSYKVDGASYEGIDGALSALSAKISSGGGSADSVVYDSSKHDQLTLGGTTGAAPVRLSNVADAQTDNDAVNLKQLKAIGLTTDTTGQITNSFVAYDNATKSSVTFNAGGAASQLKNVAAGVDATDAVNVSQMQAYVGSRSLAGNGVAYDDSTMSRVTLGGVGSTTPVKLTNIADGTDAGDAVTFGQFSALQSKVSNITTGGGGGTGGNTYITINGPATDSGTPPVAPVATGTDAIAIGNGASATGLSAIAVGARTVVAGDKSVGLGADASAPAMNAVALGSGSVADRDNSVSVGALGAERQITNVAAGSAPTDAVNVGQLSSAMGGVYQSMRDIDRNASKGIAAASALNVVTPYLPGRTTLNAGVASYRGQQALGIGVSRWNDKGTVNYNLGVSSSGGNSTIVRAGIGIVLGN